MSTARVSGVSAARRPLRLGDERHVALAAAALADGVALAHGFASIYALTSRPDADVVRAVNTLKGRPAQQTGSVVTTPSRLLGLFDLAQLPRGLTPQRLLDVVDAVLTAGPCGLRGPAAAHLPDHLCRDDAGVRTTQVITPGYACPSNGLIAACLSAAGGDHLHTTSANRSRHTTGAAEEPAHHRAADLAADLAPEFASGRFLLVGHDDESTLPRRYPHHAATSTTVLALHRLAPASTARRPAVVVERHGSLSVDRLRQLLDPIGVDAVLGPTAGVRLSQRP